MKQLLDKIIKMGMGQYMDNSRQELIIKDETFQQYNQDEWELEEQYKRLELSEEQRELINAYISSVKIADNRYSDISYMAGIKDTVRIFLYLGLLKDERMAEKEKGDS